MMNLKDYQEKKAKGLVTLVKAGEAYATAVKKFDPDTGAALPDEVVGVSTIELTDKKTALLAEIAEIDSFIADCELLNTKEAIVLDTK